MKPDWKQFLADVGGEFEEDALTGFGNPALEARAALGGHVFCDLSHQGRIAVSGPDTEAFLQGQITSDMRDVMGGRSRLGAHCTHKGRMLSLFRLFRYGSVVYLSLPRSMLEATLNRLRMYLLRVDVSLEDAGDAFVGLGLIGPDAEALLRDAWGDAPAAVDETVMRDEVLAIRVPAMDGRQRYEMYGELDAMETLWNKLNVQAAPGGRGAWELCETLAGVPVVYPQTAEAFVPQMANLGLLGGVSFDKGCYTGQEVVARMEYRGELKRRMVLLRGAPEAPAPGVEVFCAGKATPVGKVVRSARHPDGDAAVLAVVRMASENGELRLEGSEGPKVSLEALPYLD